jgi:hypothetical protein
MSNFGNFFFFLQNSNKNFTLKLNKKSILPAEYSARRIEKRVAGGHIATTPYHTITLQVAASSVEERGVRSQFLAEMLLFRYDKSSHTLHITHTNTRSTSYI